MEPKINIKEYEMYLKNKRSATKTCLITTMVLYFSFILCISFAPQILATPIFYQSLTAGIFSGISLIIASIFIIKNYINTINQLQKPIIINNKNNEQ